MTRTRAELAAAVRPFGPDGRLLEQHLPALNALADALGLPVNGAAVVEGPYVPGTLTPRILAELVGHEAIVREAYRDSVGVWTWSVGITSASGHDVDRYKDNPQPLARCLEMFVWLVRKRYLPAVLEAFAGRSLTEAQLGATLSFHYNTGAIGRASWVKAPTRAGILEWRKPPEIIARREKEAALFFDGKWSNDGRATVYPVRKPSYSPDFRNPERVDIFDDLVALLGSGK